MIRTIKNIISAQLYPISLYSRQIAGTAVLLLITRLLSVHDFGIFRSYLAIVSFWLMFANLGYHDYILVSSKNVVSEVKSKIVLFLFNAVCVSVLIGIGGMLSNLEAKLIFILVLIRTFLDVTFFALMLPYYQAAKKFVLISWINIFYSIMTILIAAISYIFKFSLAKFLFLGILLGVFNFIQCSYYARMNYMRILMHFKKLLLKLDKTVFVYSGVTVCWYLYNQLPHLYSATFVSKEDTALYFAAFSIANIIALLLSAIVQKMVPELINANLQKIKQVIGYNLKFILVFDICLTVFFAIFGKQLLHLIYGKAYYSEAYLMLLILSLANISMAVASIYGAYITASGNQKIKLQMQIEAIFVTLAGILLLHKYGIYAAAVSYFLSATYVGVRYVFKTKALLKNSVVN